MSIFVSILALSVLYFIAVSVSKYGNKYYWFFELFHFLGGFFAAMFLANFISGAKTLVILVVLMGILWELGELIVNKNRKIRQFLIDRFNFHVTKVTPSDSTLDLFLDLLGALTFVFLFK